MALVGESGSGKTTVGRCIVRLIQPTGGRIVVLGRDITRISRNELRPLRRQMHIVFQDPYSSLNPRMTVGQIVGGPLGHHASDARGERRALVAEMLGRVGLRPELQDRYPHSLSGGQRQRVAIARALIIRPALLVADEPISALDASVQAATLNLLVDLQAEMRFACLFITHDLSAAEFLADRIAVMYLGQIVEDGTREEIFARPRHPYTQALLSAVLDRRPGACSGSGARSSCPVTRRARSIRRRAAASTRAARSPSSAVAIEAARSSWIRPAGRAGRAAISSVPNGEAPRISGTRAGSMRTTDGRGLLEPDRG